jgi:hypothetical protein
VVSNRHRRPAPIGAMTRTRLILLEAVNAGRVRWLIRPGIAEHWPVTGEAYDATETFIELVQARWALVVPWDEDARPQPLETPTAITSAGIDALIEARQRARQRAKRRKAA